MRCFEDLKKKNKKKKKTALVLAAWPASAHSELTSAGQKNANSRSTPDLLSICTVLH